MLIVYIDADACPVKDEVYRVATRYQMRVAVVANAPLRVPTDPRVELVVREGFRRMPLIEIAEQVGPGDIVVTADIPLAARCIAKDARVLGPKGNVFTENDSGSTPGPALLSDLRQSGEVTGGPAPMTPKDRSRLSWQNWMS